MDTTPKTITGVIKTKEVRKDKYGKSYLLLHLANGETIRVFPPRISYWEWPQLKEGKKYLFICEPDNDLNALVAWELVKDGGI